MRMLIVFALLFMGACGGCDKATTDAKPAKAEAVDAPASATPVDAPAEVTP